MTVNRSCKQTGGGGGGGGLSCKTQNLGAVERWTRTNHLMVALREHMDNKLGIETVELGAGPMQREERDVCMIKSCLERRLPDMLDPTKRITKLATGVTADEEMTRARDKFIESITSINNKQSYYSPIKKQNIMLFNINKKKQSIAVDGY